MTVKKVFTELWRTKRFMSLFMAGALVVDVGLTLLLLGVMVPGLERDRTLLMQQRNLRSAHAGDAQQAVTRLQSFYRQVPTYDDFPDFLRQLHGYAADAGLKIDRITYRPGQAGFGNILSYTMDFSVAGPYRQVKKFLQALETWPGMTVIEQVQLAGQAPDRDAVVLSMRLAAYFRAGST